jgi:hypothetical protein
VDPRTGVDDVEMRKILSLPGLEFQPFGCDPIANRYIDWVILASNYEDIEVKAASYFEVRLLGFPSIFLTTLSDLGTKTLSIPKL